MWNYILNTIEKEKHTSTEFQETWIIHRKSHTCQRWHTSSLYRDVEKIIAIKTRICRAAPRWQSSSRPTLYIHIVPFPSFPFVSAYFRSRLRHPSFKIIYTYTNHTGRPHHIPYSRYNDHTTCVYKKKTPIKFRGNATNTEMKSLVNHCVRSWLYYSIVPCNMWTYLPSMRYK